MNPTLFFYHANGFPAQTYSQFLDKMDRFPVKYIDILGSGIISLEGSMQKLVEEVILHAASAEGNAVGIGHSLGATLCHFAEAAHPGLFRTLFLLDPPVFAPWKRTTIRVLRRLGLEHWFSPGGKTLHRREFFDSREEALNYFLKKPLFRNFSRRTVELYVRHGLEPDYRGFRLVIPREREAEIFFSVPVELPPNFAEPTGTMVHAENLDVLGHKDLRWWQKTFPKMEMVSFVGGHLFPLEHPDRLAVLIKEKLEAFLDGNPCGFTPNLGRDGSLSAKNMVS